MTDFDDRPSMESRHGDNEVDREIYRDNIRSDFQSLGIVLDDVGDIPASATVRQSAGFFDDPMALLQWMLDGPGQGLVSFDEDNNPVPIGWLYLLESYDEDLDQWFYEVWIDQDSN